MVLSIQLRNRSREGMTPKTTRLGFGELGQRRNRLRNQTLVPPPPSLRNSHFKPTAALLPLLCRLLDPIGPSRL